MTKAHLNPTHTSNCASNDHLLFLDNRTDRTWEVEERGAAAAGWGEGAEAEVKEVVGGEVERAEGGYYNKNSLKLIFRVSQDNLKMSAMDCTVESLFVQSKSIFQMPTMRTKSDLGIKHMLHQTNCQSL